MLFNSKKQTIRHHFSDYTRPWLPDDFLQECYKSEGPLWPQQPPDVGHNNADANKTPPLPHFLRRHPNRANASDGHSRRRSEPRRHFSRCPATKPNSYNSDNSSTKAISTSRASPSPVTTASVDNTPRRKSIQGVSAQPQGSRHPLCALWGLYQMCGGATNDHQR